MADRLSGKCALITGAGAGIGLAIARLFHEEGAQVYLADIDENRLEAARDALPGAREMILDVSDESSWQAAVAVIEGNGDRWNVLVNNAGIPSQSPLEETTLAEWRRVMAVNLDGPFLGCKYAVRHMKQNGGGSIVNVSSVGGLKGSLVGPAYGASKAGVWNLTKTVSLYCARSGFGIRCNSLHPGLTRTPMMDAVPAETISRLEAGIPMGELAEPVDIANAALYLASDEARYTTGAALVVDGGYTV